MRQIVHFHRVEILSNYNVLRQSYPYKISKASKLLRYEKKIILFLAILNSVSLHSAAESNTKFDLLPITQNGMCCFGADLVRYIQVWYITSCPVMYLSPLARHHTKLRLHLSAYMVCPRVVLSSTFDQPPRLAAN